jgi:hypothetical protein
LGWTFDLDLWTRLPAPRGRRRGGDEETVKHLSMQRTVDVYFKMQTRA